MEENRPDFENTDSQSERESLRVQKTAYLRRQLARRRQEEDIQWERLVQEQQVIDRLREDMDGDMDWMEESRRYHRDLKEDLDAQIYALYGISADKLEGMREYGQAFYRGSAAVLFLLSAALCVLSGIFYGFQTEITLFMIACTAMEGTLLSQEGKRVRVLEWVCRFLYLLLFPVMLFAFICHMRQDPLYELCLPYMSMIGIGLTVLGTVSTFLYNPYRRVRRKFCRAKKQIAEIEKTAGREVRKNQKNREKEETRIQRRREKEERLGQRVQEKEERQARRIQEREARQARRVQEKEERQARRVREKEESRRLKEERQEEVLKPVRPGWRERRQRFLEQFHKKKVFPEAAAEPSAPELTALPSGRLEEKASEELPVTEPEEASGKQPVTETKDGLTTESGETLCRAAAEEPGKVSVMEPAAGEST